MNANKRSYPVLPMESSRRRTSEMRRNDGEIGRSPSEQSKEEKKASLGKVCLICYCSPADFMTGDFSYGERGGDMDHCLFLLDLDAEGGDYVPRDPYADFDMYDDGYVPRNPDLCFDSFGLSVSGFCVLGSSLYFFGYKTNEVFSYELLLPPPPPQLSQGVITLTKNMLTPCPPMNFPKLFARGCQTPDGKMLVLSSKICLSKEGSGVFELFDPRTQRWEPLPDLLPLLPRPHEDGGEDYDDCEEYCTGIDVCSFSFVDNEPDLHIATSKGNFTLDMRRPDNGWSPREDLKFAPSLRPRFMLVKDGGELCLSEWFAFLLDGRDESVWRYPSLEPRVKPGCNDVVVIGYSYRSSGRGLTWLPPSSSDRFCIAHTHVQRSTKQPYLIVDACSFDSYLFQRKKMELFETDWELDVPGLTVMKRFKFVLGPQKGYERVKFNHSGIFPISW